MVDSFLDNTRSFHLGSLEIAISGEVIFVYLHSSTTERAIVLLAVGGSALDGGTDGEHSKNDEGGVT